MNASLVSVLVLLTVCPPFAAAQEGPRSVTIGDPVVTEMIARHARAKARIEKRTARIEDARRTLQRKRQALLSNDKAKPSKPTGEKDVAAPGTHITLLRQDASLLDRIEVWERRRLSAAIDHEYATRNALRETDAMIARRKRLKRPRRGPLALGDPTLAALLEYRGSAFRDQTAATQKTKSRRGELDAFLLTKSKRGDELRRAERANKAARNETTRADQETQSKLAKRREALARRERDLVAEEAKLEGNVQRERRALIAALRHDPEGNGHDLPMADVCRNIVAQASFRQTLLHRARLVELRERQRTNDLGFARYHADRVNYLNAVRASGVRLPKTPSLDPAVAERDARDAQRRAAERAARATELDGESARTRKTLNNLEAEATALLTSWRSGATRGDFARLPKLDPLARAPALPPKPSAVVREADRRVGEAKHERESARRELYALGQAWRATVDRALGRATQIAAHPTDHADHAEWMKDFDQARHKLARKAKTSRALAERYTTSRRTLERRLAELSLAIDRTPAPVADDWWTNVRAHWFPTLRRWSERLPVTPALIGIAALFLAIGVLAGRVRHLRWLGTMTRLICLAGTVALAGVGLERGGPAGTALVGTAALGAFLLLGAFPVNLVAGLTMFFSGDAAPGTKITDGTVEGRVIRRGLLVTRVAVGDADGREEVVLGNASLMRADPATRSSPRNVPQPSSVTVRVTIDSDWMAVRELAERIADREIERPRVRFYVESDGIRLVLRGARRFDAEAVERRLAQAIDHAPFAQRLDNTKEPTEENGP